MEISHTTENNYHLISSQGQLALENVSRLEEYLAPFLEDTTHAGIILDFADISFVDSKGVSLIILTNMTLQNHKALFALMNVNEKIMEVFNLSGLSKHIRIFADKETAMKELATVEC